jgi:hypothetical protein
MRALCGDSTLRPPRQRIKIEQPDGRRCNVRPQVERPSWRCLNQREKKRERKVRSSVRTGLRLPLRSGPPQAHGGPARRVGTQLRRGRQRCPWRQTGLPGSPRTRVVARSVLRPRQDRTRQAINGVPTRTPPVTRTCALATRIAFRAPSPGSTTSRSTLHRAARTAPRKTRFRLLARLCRAGSDTRRVPTKDIHDALVTSIPRFSSFPGATSPFSLGAFLSRHRPPKNRKSVRPALHLLRVWYKREPTP